MYVSVYVCVCVCMCLCISRTPLVCPLPRTHRFVCLHVQTQDCQNCIIYHLYQIYFMWTYYYQKCYVQFNIYTKNCFVVEIVYLDFKHNIFFYVNWLKFKWFNLLNVLQSWVHAWLSRKSIYWSMLLSNVDSDIYDKTNTWIPKWVKLTPNRINMGLWS